MLLKITRPIRKTFTKEIVFTPGQIVEAYHDVGTAYIVVPLGVQHKARRVDKACCEPLNEREARLYEKNQRH
jgi:hypothetical protein